MNVCRPERLTFRWVSEITGALNRVCGFQIPIDPSSSSLPEQQWQAYWLQFQTQFPRCQDPNLAQRILNFEVDYRTLSSE